MKKFIAIILNSAGLLLLIFFTNSLEAQQVIKVGAGEYLTVYLMSDKTVKVSSQATITPILTTYPGLDSIIDVQGGQYHVTALDQQGKVYKLDKYAGSTIVNLDYLNNTFTGNFQVKGFWQCNVSIRNPDSTLWYWGIDDPMNYSVIEPIVKPIQLTQPNGKKFKKVETGSSSGLNDAVIYALASDNTLWKYTDGNTTPTQITIAGETFKDFALLGSSAIVITTNSNKIYGWGPLANYVGAASGSSTPINITSAWTSAGVTFPIKELVANSNTLHIIDANNNMFGSGTNVQGEVGTGVEYSPYRIAGPQGGVFGYGFVNNLLVTPPTQIQGKFKNLNTSTTITFYLYVQDMGNNWYSWGRNKGFSLGNGKSAGPYAGWGGTGDYASYPNAMDVPMPKRVNPATVTWVLQSFNPNNNLPPVVGAGINQYLTAVSSTTLYGKAFQQEQTISNSNWTKVSGPVGGIITNPGSLNTMITGLTNGTYVYRLSATNSNGQTSTDDVSIIVTSSNIAPTANAGTNASITLPANTTVLNGIGTDTDGTIVSYLWVKISGPAAGALSNANTANTTATGLVQGLYSYELTVTDNAGAIGTDTVNVTVNAAANQAPNASAGLDINITLPINSTPLSGAGIDPDGTIASYAWVKISGPAAGTLANANTANATAANLIQGLYSYELTVTDNAGATGKDTVNVTVNSAANLLPTANAGLDVNITLPINSTPLSGAGIDPDGIIASYAWVKISGPAAGTLTNVNTANAIAASLIQGVYSYELTVTDNAGATGKDTVNVTVNSAANQLPTANAGLDVNITLPINSTPLSGAGIDPDGTIASYAWVKLSGPAAGTLTNVNTANTTATSLVQGVYSYQLTVMDNAGGTGRDTVNVTVIAASNQAPNANAGLDANITLPTNSVTLNGSGTDPDGTISTYQWVKISGPASGTITNANIGITTATGLVQGIYRFEIGVTDNIGASDRDTMQVTVNAAINQAPSANAGNNINITLPVNTATLNGSGTDPDGIIASYAWVKLSGPAAGTLTNANTANASAASLIQGVYSYQLTVTDNAGATARDTVNVTVNAATNQAPIVNAGLDANITLPTNSVTLNGSATDPDGTIASYTWVKISGPSAGIITNSNIGITTATGLVQGIYRFELRVTDNSGASNRDTMQVTVNAALNQAPSANAGNNINITLPVNTTTLNGSGTDPDGTIASYAWVKISGPAAGTLTNANTANAMAAGLVQGEYSYQLTVTDNAGATGRDTLNVTVNVAANQAPTANAGLDANITLPTNSVTLNGSATDPDGTISTYQWVKISGPASGIITNANIGITKATGLVQGIYRFEIRVTDNSGASDRDTMQVTVNASINQVPSANAGLDANITLPTNSVALNGSGIDADGTISTYQWIKIAGPASGTITNATNGITTATGLVQGIYRFELKVTDNSGAIGQDTMQVTVNAAIIINEAPLANAGNDMNIYLPQDSVGLTGNGMDADGTIIAYHWRVINNSGQYFLSNPNNQQTLFNNLEQGIYELEFSVTDNRGAKSSDTVIVIVGSSRQSIYRENVNVYPNPVINILYVDIESSVTDKSISLSLYDSKGANVFQKIIKLSGNTKLETIDMSNLKMGVYFLQVNYGENKQQVKQIIKM